ncbi:MAG: hypothetical protein SAK29_43015 [Scytonema sp. PMC 1069.18]|nr:hypothetical protein [Scytonema sp. PMC 1069.18]MEC4887123.1 hypothetical protein [Scytonema sp. PMC 1070.18]
MSEPTPPPPRGGDRREGKNQFMSERAVMDIPTFLERFQAATTDKEKLLLVATLLETVAVELSENQESKECKEAIYNFFTHLASELKENT